MGTNATDSANRRRLRRRLEAQGYPPAEVDRLVEQRRADQMARRRHDTKMSTQAERRAQVRALHDERDDTYEATYRRLNGDDRGFKPTKHDPLTQGQGRVTAKAARRGRSVTKFEYDQAQAGS